MKGLVVKFQSCILPETYNLEPYLEYSSLTLIFSNKYSDLSYRLGSSSSNVHNKYCPNIISFIVSSEESTYSNNAGSYLSDFLSLGQCLSTLACQSLFFH